MLISIFTALIAGSIQDVLADDITDMYKPVPMRNSEYQVHLQVIIRDASGGLISVIESTTGYYLADEITDEAFDYCFGPSICEKEIVVIDNKKYEKVPFAQKYGMDSPVDVLNFKQSLQETSFSHALPKMSFFIRAIIQTEENSMLDLRLFQVFVPLIYIEEGDEIKTQWNVLREFN